MTMLALLAACGYTGIRREIVRDGPVVVNLNRGIIFQDQYAYENIAQSALEKRLVEIAGTATVEESWIYDPATGRLREIGFFEDKHYVHNFLDPVLQSNRRQVHYHLHQINGFSYSSGNRTKSQVVEKLNGDNSMMALPSELDIEAAIYVKNVLHVDLTWKIVDYEGILTYSLPTIISKNLPALVASLQQEYFQFRIGFKEYVDRMEELGITIDYQQLRDISFSEENITINKN